MVFMRCFGFDLLPLCLVVITNCKQLNEIRTKMKQKTMLLLLSLVVMTASAQITLKGIGHDNRYKKNKETCQMETEYLGWNNTLQKSIFIVENGIYGMTWNGSSLSAPEKDPAVVKEEIKGNNEKEIWANNFNMMYGNSGACYVNGKLVTVSSRDESSTVDEELFRVCKWDAKTGALLSTEIRPKSDHLESAGMSYNPKDGKVYGLFYLTGNQLSEEITSDPEYFADQDDDMTDGDAGYAICTVDLKTMKVTPVTPGLYYYNFITFAINSEGRAFALTSGGSNAVPGEDGKQRDIDNKLTGAQLYEFDLTTGLMKTKAVQKTDSETGELYTDYEPLVGATGYSSQYRRQAACFAKSNPNKMYWVGYFNSGKGVNEWGSWSSLPDKDWETNGKYDTSLYEVDITTGEATRLANVDKRWIFSALWVEGDDCSDGADVDPFNPGGDIPTTGNFIAIQQADNGSIWQHVEMGQQYSYFIEASEGWKVHSVTFNGSQLTVEENVVVTPAVSLQYNRLIVTYEQQATAIEQAPAATPSKALILGSAEGVHIANAKAGDQVTVCGVDGRVVYSRKLSGTYADISLKPNTLYIIKVADKVVKVKL